MEQGTKSADPLSHQLRLIAGIVDLMYVPLAGVDEQFLTQKYEALRLIALAQRLADKRRLGAQKLRRVLHKRNARFARYVRKNGTQAR